jgi:hypothetical protein
MDSIREWLEDYILAEAGHTPQPELDTRISALREMFRNHRNMTADQFQEVMTVAHFATYFADALSRSFYSDYAYQVGQWMNYTFPDTAPDFRDVDRARMSEPEELKRRRELRDSAETEVAATWISYGVEEYSNAFVVSWQTIMNDDLAEIQRTPARMANAARRWADTFVSALYDNATTQASLIALGLVYGGTGRLTHLNLAVGLNAMRQRLDTRGNPINIPRVHLVIPSILEIQARTIMASTLAAGIATNDANVLPGFLAGIWIDPYITTTAASVPWYLFADPSNIPAVTVARLRGWTQPIVYQRASDIRIISGSVPAPFLLGDARHGAIRYYVEDILGGWDSATWVGVTDHNGIYYSNGTTP